MRCLRAKHTHACAHDVCERTMQRRACLHVVEEQLQVVQPHQAHLKRRTDLPNPVQPAALSVCQADAVTVGCRARRNGFKACDDLLLLVNLVQKARAHAEHRPVQLRAQPVDHAKQVNLEQTA